MPTHPTPNLADLFPALAKMAAGRDHVLTKEFAKSVGCADQTARKNYSQTGECYGVRPIKRGNRLLWPVAGIAAILSGKVAK